MVRRSVKGFGTNEDRPTYSHADIDRIVAASGGLPPGRCIVRDRPDANAELARVLGLPPGLLPDRPAPKPRYVSRRRALGLMLERAAHDWALGRFAQKLPTWRLQAVELARIENAAERLLKALNVDDGGSIERMPLMILNHLMRRAATEGPAAWPPARRSQREELLGDAVLGVARLYRWAGQARKMTEALAASREPPPRRTADEALNALFRDWAEIWVVVFGRKVRTSVGAPGRPNKGKAGGPFVRFVQSCAAPLGIDLTENQVRGRVRTLYSAGMGKSPQKKS